MPKAVKVDRRKLDKIIADLKDVAISVGVQGAEASATRSDGTPNVVVAAAHEYGTATIPERSYLRSTIRRENKKYAKLFGKVVRDSANGKQLKVDHIGQTAVNDIRSTIRAGISPPLKYREGTPLYDTGQLVNSITFEVLK